MKPQILKTPKKGKLFGASENDGVCDTLEWMKNVCNNIRGDGIAITVDRTDEDSPTIKLKPEVMDQINNLSASAVDLSVTLEGNTYGSEKITGDMVFEAMPSCNISVETSGETIRIGVYYI